MAEKSPTIEHIFLILNSDHDSGGGGIRIDHEKAIFNMHGGKIAGNSTNHKGGGVYVHKGIFNMHNGEILGNNAGNGGGVFSYNSFRIVNGTIYGEYKAFMYLGEEEDDNVKNKAYKNPALYGNFEYGTFSGDVWNKNGSDSWISISRRTIIVVNGMLMIRDN